MRAKDLKPIYKAKGFKNLEELAAAVGVGREHLNNALNRKRGMSPELTERLAQALELPPDTINPDYRRLCELTAEEWNLIQSFRRVPRKNARAILRMILVMLDEASRDNAA